MLPERIGVFLALAAAICLPLAGAAPSAPPEPFAACAASWSSACHVAPPPVAGAKIRTPDGLDVAAAEKLAQSLGLQFSLRQLTAEEAGPALASGQVDLVLGERVGVEVAAAVPGAQLAWQGTGYAVRPKAVIRSDTRMRSGADTRGRRVCMAQATAAQAQRAPGAEVRTYRVPSDALVAVREGDCDVGLIDDALWEPLMRFPEWKKFSSTLAAEGRAPNGRGWCPPRRRPTAPGWPPKCAPGTAPAPGRRWPPRARDVAFDVWTWNVGLPRQEAPRGHAMRGYEPHADRALRAPGRHQEKPLRRLCRARVHGG